MLNPGIRNEFQAKVLKLILKNQKKKSAQNFNISSCLPIIPTTHIRGVSRPLRCGNAADADSHCGNNTSAAKTEPSTLFTLHTASPPASQPTLTPGHTSSESPEQGKKGNMLIGVMTSWVLVIITVKKCTENFSRDILSVCPSELRH